MEDKIIIGIVVAVAVAAHGWIIVWIRFKMDEGVITKFLKETGDQEFHSTEAISSNTHIASKRVSAVCSKSKIIKGHANEQESWRLN